MIAEELAKRQYTIVTGLDATTTGKPIYIAYSPEVRYCIGQGHTPDAARAGLLSARIDLFQSLLDDGLPIPEPQSWQSGEVINVNLGAPWGY